MGLTWDGNRAFIFSVLYVLFYYLTSLMVYLSYGTVRYENGVPVSRQYDSKIGMFTMSEDINDGNGTVIGLVKTSGYMMEIKISTNYFDEKGTSSTDTYKEYPRAMEFVYWAFFWLPLIGLFVVVPVLTLILYNVRHFCNLKVRTTMKLCCVMFGFVFLVHILAYFLYIHMIGEEVGFSWGDLTATVYVGLVNACLGPIVLPFLILCQFKHSKPKGLHKMWKSLVYVEYKKKNDSSEVERPQYYRRMSIPQLKPFFILFRGRIDKNSFIDNIKSHIEKVWMPHKVGIGRDAGGLYHSSINIIKVKPIGNKAVFQRYLERKKQIENFAASVGGALFHLESYAPGLKPIQTADLLKRSPISEKSLDCDINEYYLLHGTPIKNLPSIERAGFDLEKCRYSMLGKGIYFTEDPVKADQYTGKNTSDLFCCMLLCRVLLGDSVLQRNVRYPEISSVAFTSPCKECMKPNRTCNCQHSTNFDSVIFEGALFREFVVYENSLAFPEYAVIYRRVRKRHDAIPIC